MNYFHDKSQLTVDEVSLNLITILPSNCTLGYQLEVEITPRAQNII